MYYRSTYYMNAVNVCRAAADSGTLHLKADVWRCPFWRSVYRPLVPHRGQQLCASGRHTLGAWYPCKLHNSHILKLLLQSLQQYCQERKFVIVCMSVHGLIEA